jgi:Protein of unknown function, DUF417
MPLFTKLDAVDMSNFVLYSTTVALETAGTACVASHDEGSGGAAMSSERSTRRVSTHLSAEAGNRVGSLAGRYGLVIVIAWFAGMKFTTYEAQGISSLVANSPFLSWVYHLMPITTLAACSAPLN